jgi:hypothetical protein
MDRTSKISLVGAIVGLLVVAYAGSGTMVVYSSTEEDFKNWGEATKDLTEEGTGAVGEHSDADGLTEPRFGLGNVKKLCDTTMKDLGDELRDGDCP